MTSKSDSFYLDWKEREHLLIIHETIHKKCERIIYLIGRDYAGRLEISKVDIFQLSLSFYTF